MAFKTKLLLQVNYCELKKLMLLKSHSQQPQQQSQINNLHNLNIRGGHPPLFE